jgi:DNA helicase-2/ATP-dependent DNA helicase PcrA
MAHIEKIFGAPGTGKTFTLVKRLQEHLDQNCPLDQTLTTTFTRVAAREIKSRIQERNNNRFTDKELHYSVRTIDSYLMSKINEDKDICYPNDYLTEFYQVRKKKEVNDDKKRNFYAAMKIITKGRITVGEGIESILKYYDAEKQTNTSRRFIIQLAESYENYKKNHLKMDWEDVKYKGLQDKIKFNHNIVLMIDEAQDCNRLEWLIINKLIAVSKNVYIAGDDDQAIYRFKGGEVETFLQLAVDKTTVLDKSPRLNKNIWKLAQAAIHLIPKERRQEKQYTPTNENKHNMPHCGLIHEFRNKESFEKNYLNMSITDPDVSIHWLFLSRNNDEKDRRYSNENYNWSQILAKNNLTWETIEKSNGVESGAERGTTPNVPTDQIQSIETWMTLQKGNKISGKETKEFYKTIPPTLIRDRKKTSLIRTDSIILKDGQYGYGDLKSKFYLDANINIPWFEILNLKTHNGEYYVDYIQYLKNIMENGNYKKSKRILLSTIHGAKGLESANTILNCDWPYLPYRTYCKGRKDRDDELRVFYVGVTRTKYNLFLYQPDFSFGEYKGMKHNNFWNKIRGK